MLELSLRLCHLAIYTLLSPGYLQNHLQFHKTVFLLILFIGRSLQREMLKRFGNDSVCTTLHLYMHYNKLLFSVTLCYADFSLLSFMICTETCGYNQSHYLIPMAEVS
ncbi:hypothetical protein Pelo_6985 [Pelomyxa schiedti]|nr:hypothetical protein Pelo_6985 [Pelomyxa schiedti]